MSNTTRSIIAYGAGIIFWLLLVFGLYPVIAPLVAQPTILDISTRHESFEDLKYVISHLPANVVNGLRGIDPALQQQLGLQVWAFDFKGGPFGIWIEIEELGQETVTARRRDPESMFPCDAKEGRLLFWYQPRVTKDMSDELKARFLSNQPQVPNLSMGLAVNGREITHIEEYGNPDKPIVPLWYGWDRPLEESSYGGHRVNPKESAVIRYTEAWEDVANARKVKLKLTVLK